MNESIKNGHHSSRDIPISAPSSSSVVLGIQDHCSSTVTMNEGYMFIIFLVLVETFAFHNVAGRVISACFSSNKSLDVDCGPGYMIHITKTFYGFSPTGQCQLVEAEADSGCTFDDQTRYPCIGRQTCSINLPTGRLGVNVPACGQRSNYFQLEYNCVLASSVSDICRIGQLTAQSGYIMTPSYPANYYDQDVCSTEIEVHPTQKINLNIIDMELEEEGKTDCADLLYFNDKLRSITLCGQRNNNSYGMHTNHLKIELRSTSRGNSKGFWLYYEAVPPLPTTRHPLVPPLPTTRHLSTPHTNPVTAAHPGDITLKDHQSKGSNWLLTTTANRLYYNNTVHLYRKDNNSGKQLSFAAIAGGVIGTLSLILLVLLILLFIKWFRERRHYKGEQILEIRNPAFKSSNDFQEKLQPNTDFHC